MLDHPHRLLSSICRRLRALACLSALGLGASQAGALPPVHADPAPAASPAAGSPPGSAAAGQRAPLADLNEVLEATRAKLEELNEAAGILSSGTNLREEMRALEEDNQRLTGELARARTRQSELESGSERTDARIAELTAAVEEVRREAAGRKDEIARLRRQNAELDRSVERAQADREAAAARAEKAEAEMTEKLEGATDAAARAKVELAAAKAQLDQAAGAAVEAERARRAATSEAEALRDDAARARDELAAAKGEVDRLKAANAGLEQQIASLHGELRAATETARQNLIVMAEKIAALNAALEAVRSEQAPPTVDSRRGQPSAADTPADANPGTSQPVRPAAPAPDDEAEASAPAGRAAEVAVAQPSRPAAAVDASLARFHADVETLNDLEMSTAGADLFSGVKSVNGREVHVGTTAAWDSLPPVGQQSYFESLLEYWVAARGGGPAVVRVVDRSGRVLVERSRP
jgi:predicted  nucleic acid-binding Zn-ribbon protein